MPPVMQAVVMQGPGGPEVLKLEDDQYRRRKKDRSSSASRRSG